MGLPATMDDIKAYLEKVEKNEITPEALSACSRCGLGLRKTTEFSPP